MERSGGMLEREGKEGKERKGSEGKVSSEMK